MVPYPGDFAPACSTDVGSYIRPGRAATLWQLCCSAPRRCSVLQMKLLRQEQEMSTQGTLAVAALVDAYTLALASVVLTAGSVADRLGRKRVFTFGVVLFTVASAACAAAGSIVALDEARAVQGTGGAIMFAMSLALLADAFPRPDERAKALAVYGGGLALVSIGLVFAVLAQPDSSWTVVLPALRIGSIGTGARWRVGRGLRERPARRGACRSGARGHRSDRQRVPDR